METSEHTINGVTFYGSLAETASNISPEEWAYRRLFDKLTDMIAEYMEEVDMSKADLARQLGTSRAYISKILAGDAHNMTIKTLSRVVFNLDAKLEVKIVPHDGIFQWIGLYKNPQLVEKKIWPSNWTLENESICGTIHGGTEIPSEELAA